MIQKKILILGSNGFIGKNLKNNFMKKLIDKKDEDEKQSVEFIFIPNRNIRIDLKNKLSLRNFIDFKRPDIVIHCAGNVGSSKLNSQKNDYNILNDNLSIIINILECCNEMNIEKLILFSTFRVFGDEIRENYDENDVHSGSIKNNFGYLQSKRIQDTLMNLFMKFNKTKIICLIMPNVFGEEDQFIIDGRIVPSLITKIKEAKKEEKDVYIDSCFHNKVNLIYVKDIVRIIEIIIDLESNELKGNIIVLNKKGVLEIGDLSKKIAELMNYNGKIFFNENKKEEKDNIMNPNLEKFNLFFTDFEFTDIELALKNTIEISEN